MKPSALFKFVYFCSKSRCLELSSWLRAKLQSPSSMKRLVTLFFCTELLWVSFTLLHREYLGTSTNGAGNSSAHFWKKSSVFIPEQTVDQAYLSVPRSEVGFRIRNDNMWINIDIVFLYPRGNFSAITLNLIHWVCWTISWAVLLNHYLLQGLYI